MSSDLYALIALAARYWFVALIVVILFRSWRMTVADNRRAKLLREWMGQTGCIGELIVNPGAKRRASYPIPREGVLGSGGNADVRIRHRDILRAHAHFDLREGGLLIKPLGRAQLSVGDGFTGQAVFLQDGDVMTIGRLQLMLVLFDAPAEEEPEDAWFEVDPNAAPPDDEEREAADNWFDETPAGAGRRLPGTGDRINGKPAGKHAGRTAAGLDEVQSRKRATPPPPGVDAPFNPKTARGRRKASPAVELPFDLEPAPRRVNSGGDMRADRKPAPGRPASGAQAAPKKARGKRAAADDDFFNEDAIWRDR